MCTIKHVKNCKESFSHEPKYWCQECIDDYVCATEYKCEGDR